MFAFSKFGTVKLFRVRSWSLWVCARR